MFYRTCEVPGVGDFSPSPGGARKFEAYSFTECGALKPPPPPGSSFSSGRKGCKRPFRGSLWTPPKDPRLILPISALYQVRASRPSLRRLARANYARSSATRWACGPMLGFGGSTGSEMPSHFRKSARRRRAQKPKASKFVCRPGRGKVCSLVKPSASNFVRVRESGKFQCRDL